MLMSTFEQRLTLQRRYTYMDEEYLDCLQTNMGWERDNGIIHLIPIAVVHQEDFY